MAAAQAAACEPPTPGLVVSPASHDEGDGSPERPFRSLGRAQSAWRERGPRTIWLDGGVYAFDAPLVLDGRDAHVALRACPGQAPALDGGAARLATLLHVAAADRVVIAGLTFAHTSGPALIVDGGQDVRIERNLFTNDGIGVLLVGGARPIVCANRVWGADASGIEAKDGVSNPTIVGNDIDGSQAPATHGGGIYVHGSEDALIRRNRVRNTRGVGIGVANWDPTTPNRGFRIVGNIVQAANRDAEDSGAIYVLGRSHLNMAGRIAGNLIQDAGAPGDAHTIGVYLDDSSSDVVVERNTIRAPFTHAVQIHGGDEVLVRDNLIDLDPAATSAVLFQAAPADTGARNTMRGNRVTRNLIRMRGPLRDAFTSIQGGAPVVADNLIVRSPEAGLAGSIGSDLVLAAPDRVEDATLIDLAQSLIGLVSPGLTELGPDASVDCSQVAHREAE